METATKNLEFDHENILRLIAVMGKMVESKNPDVVHLETAVDLIKHYADGFHHAKEENLLFPMMAKRGFSFEQGPIAVMLHDHVEGRGYVKAMTEHIELYKNGKKDALKPIFENMHLYAELLQGHIYKENNILFKMADHALSESDQASLLVQFKEIESNGGILKESMDKIEELERKY